MNKKKVVKLTESKLHSIVVETVKQILKEENINEDPSSAAYNLVVMLGEIHNDATKNNGQIIMSIDELNEIYNYATIINEYFENNNI